MSSYGARVHTDHPVLTSILEGALTATFADIPATPAEDKRLSVLVDASRAVKPHNASKHPGITPQLATPRRRLSCHGHRAGRPRSARAPRASPRHLPGTGSPRTRRPATRSASPTPRFSAGGCWMSSPRSTGSTGATVALRYYRRGTTALSTVVRSRRSAATRGACF